MSSSRSIAAARNRRAGESVPTNSNNRPVTSIASQSSFSQQSQSQSKRSITAQNSTPNVPVSTNAKLTVSDAIGLITLRLGRVEQILIDIEHNGGLGSGSNIPDTAHIFDKSVINSIVNRLDSLEKRDKESSSNQQIIKLESEIRDIKDLLMAQLVKHEKFTSETNKRFEDIDSAFVEIEKHQELLSCSHDTQTEDITVEYKNDTTIVSSNLKSVIEQELADSSSL